MTNKNTIGITWVDAPEPAPKSGGKHAEFIAALKKRPGDWAIAPYQFTNKGQAYNMATNFKQARISGTQPAGSFEATVRGTTVYVRYVGGVK